MEKSKARQKPNLPLSCFLPCLLPLFPPSLSLSLGAEETCRNIFPSARFLPQSALQGGGGRRRGKGRREERHLHVAVRVALFNLASLKGYASWNEKLPVAAIGTGSPLFFFFFFFRLQHPSKD